MTLVIFDTLRRCEDNATFVSDSDPSSLRREISFHLDVNAVRNVIPFHGLPAEKINGREERKWGGRGTRATRDYSVRQRRRRRLRLRLPHFDPKCDGGGADNSASKNQGRLDPCAGEILTLEFVREWGLLRRFPRLSLASPR